MSVSSICRIQYVSEFCAEVKNAVSEARDWGMQTFAVQCRGGTWSMNTCTLYVHVHSSQDLKWPYFQVTTQENSHDCRLHWRAHETTYLLKLGSLLVWGNTVCVWQSRVQLKHILLCSLTPQSTVSWYGAFAKGRTHEFYCLTRV